MNPLPYDVSRFHSQVDLALNSVRKILDINLHPTYPDKIAHSYNDKYLLAEQLTTITLSSCLFILKQLGLNDNNDINKLRELANNKSITLRFSAEEKCNFIREENKQIESAREYVTEISSNIGT